jgi:transcriptional regulator with XRE-family HTH domain
VITLPPHGTISRRKHHGCKCCDCCEAVRAYTANRHRAQADGTWQAYVDAEPVRQHLLRLQASNVPIREVVRLTGLPHRTIAGFLYPTGAGRGRKRSARPETARKILAVTNGIAVPTTVDAIGTRRRFQALIAAGWTQSQIAKRVGLTPPHLSSIVNEHVITIYGRTALAVADAYEVLRRQRPEKQGVSAAGATRSRRSAAEHRWPPARYWDRFPGAIDDPHFTPEYGMTKADLLAEEAGFLVTVAGLSRAQAAARLGKDKTYVDRVLGQRSIAAAA